MHLYLQEVYRMQINLINVHFNGMTLLETDEIICMAETASGVIM